MNNGVKSFRPSSVRRKIDLRGVAEFHAAGHNLNTSSVETQHLIRLALNEAEALAAQTGVAELVLPALAEEKVSALRKWAARQAALRNRAQEMSLAA